jgi:superfamily I DNA/RNA helicase
LSLPVKQKGEHLLKDGVKVTWLKMAGSGWTPENKMLNLRNLHAWGATAKLQQMIADGSWLDLPAFEGARLWLAACQRWGIEHVQNPRIRCGTIHSVKGAEADHVVLLKSISEPIERNMRHQAGIDEEIRVWYVGVTRAKRSLTILRDPREKEFLDFMPRSRDW